MKHNEANHPPRTHNILNLLAATPFVLTPAQTQVADKLNGLQLEGRYPGDTEYLYRQVTGAMAQSLLTATTDFIQCLRKLLP